MTRLTLLTQKACTFCDQAKDVLARIGAEHPIEIDELDLDTPEGRSLAMRHGVLFAPGILIDGELVSYGRPSERRLRRELDRRVRAGHGGRDE
jgi:glutaredoxin